MRWDGQSLPTFLSLRAKKVVQSAFYEWIKLRRSLAANAHFWQFLFRREMRGLEVTILNAVCWQLLQPEFSWFKFDNLLGRNCYGFSVTGLRPSRLAGSVLKKYQTLLTGHYPSPTNDFWSTSRNSFNIVAVWALVVLERVATASMRSILFNRGAPINGLWSTW